MDRDNKISRRSLLRSTATLTAGIVAAGATGAPAAETATPLAVPAEIITPDHDPATGEIVDRERHHRWDTV